jgi:hypothetical protein
MKISIVTYSVNVIINTKIEKMLEIWSLQIDRQKGYLAMPPCHDASQRL